MLRCQNYCVYICCDVVINASENDSEKSNVSDLYLRKYTNKCCILGTVFNVHENLRNPFMIS